MYKSSNRGIRASRANGAHARGPRTPAGKARSSQNAIPHGLLAKCFVMAGESSPGFDALLYQHQARFAPADGVDQGYVEVMAAALGGRTPRPEFALSHRYETRLHMHYPCAPHNFLLVHAACIPKEPSPTPEHQPLVPSPPRQLVPPSPPPL